MVPLNKSGTMERTTVACIEATKKVNVSLRFFLFSPAQTIPITPSSGATNAINGRISCITVTSGVLILCLLPEVN